MSRKNAHAGLRDRVARQKRSRLCQAYEERHRQYGYRHAPANKKGFHSMSTSHWAAYQQWIGDFRRVVMDIGLVGNGNRAKARWDVDRKAPPHGDALLGSQCDAAQRVQITTA